MFTLFTFTCCEWLPLIEETQAYDLVYNWFNHLRLKGHFVVAYMIMPNHLHVLIEFARSETHAINTTIGNGKRFLAYEIIRRLKDMKKEQLLQTLQTLVKAHDRRAGKRHQVFEPSFDWKHCYGRDFIFQKVRYIHANPVRKGWRLVDDPVEYEHSSARFYAFGVVGRCEAKDYRVL